MTRILIADDHDVVRAGLRTILQSHAGWEVVAEASDGKEAVELAIATRPDIAVLDFGLPTLNGVEATRQIRSKLSRVEILIFTMHDTDALVRDVLEAGARGFLLKSDASRFLISAVETLADHKPFFTGKVSEALLESFLLKKPSEGALTGREKSVIQLIAEGRPNRKRGFVRSRCRPVSGSSASPHGGRGKLQSDDRQGVCAKRRDPCSCRRRVQLVP